MHTEEVLSWEIHHQGWVQSNRNLHCFVHNYMDLHDMANIVCQWQIDNVVLVTELMACCIVDMHDGLYSCNQHLLDVSESFETGCIRKRSLCLKMA